MSTLQRAIEGYDTPTSNPYLYTSINSDAWRIGQWLKQTGRTYPRDVRKSRGDTYHVNGMKVRINYIQGCTEIERIA
jgi:hypothetical protein